MTVVSRLKRVMAQLSTSTTLNFVDVGSFGNTMTVLLASKFVRGTASCPVQVFNVHVSRTYVLVHVKLPGTCTCTAGTPIATYAKRFTGDLLL